MSAAGRAADRVQHDSYPTPAWAVHRLLEVCPLPPGVWLEPCAGDGAIIEAVNTSAHYGVSPLTRDVPCIDWFAHELREECRKPLSDLIWRDRVSIGSYLAVDLSGADVIITNPPFALSFEIAQKAVREAPVVALLLRLNWLASSERAPWLMQHTPSVYVLPDRPAFVASIACSNRKLCGWRETMPLDAPWPRTCPSCSAKTTRGTTDATDYAWFVWGLGQPVVTVLRPTPLAERQASTTPRAA
jgi:hypothetical protein